jgi:FMN phosphatase YigB (HAD superfamily)
MTFALPALVLFDLDDTLLSNNMDVFMPAYLESLTRYSDREIAPELLLSSLLSCVKGLMADESGELNADVFWRTFVPLIGKDRATLEAFFATYYRSHFGTLRACTATVPGALEVVAWFRRQNIPAVIATNPVFPRDAIVERMRWAGFDDPSEFALVTTLENMHATKPHARYYAEITQRLNTSPDQTLMVGNDWDNDIEPAAGLGCRTFHVIPAGQFVAPSAPGVGRGSLAELHVYLTQ